MKRNMGDNRRSTIQQSQEDVEDNIVIRERTDTRFEYPPFQSATSFSETQGEWDHEKQQNEQTTFQTKQKNIRERNPVVARENDFAALEAMLESQEEEGGNNIDEAAKEIQSAVEQANAEEDASDDNVEGDVAHAIEDHNREAEMFAPSKRTRQLRNVASTARILETSAIEDTSTSLLLQKNRRLAEKQRSKTGSKTHAKMSKNLGHKVAFKTSKSIVGSRPSHWGLEATNRPRTDPRRTRQNLDARRKPPSFTMSSLLSTAASKQQVSPVRSTGRDKSDKNNPSAQLSFVPGFLPPQTFIAQHNERQDDQPTVEEMDSDHNENCISSPSPAQQHASPPPTRTRASTGPLLKRLRTIRDSVRGDSVRFHSGQYPFSSSSFDMNDPRNRAKTHVDVTILGESMNSQLPLSPVAAYVHSFCVRTSNKKCASHILTSNESSLPSKCVAWICFKKETTQENQIQKGSELRIYNPMPLILSEPISLTGVGPCRHVQWVVLCTDLCEAYHESLPELPSLNEILNCLS